jgi:hypothetical protein
MFLLNQYDRHFTEPKDGYHTTGNTFTQHVTDSKWVLDKDQFSVKQFLRPYGGTIYYGLARSACLNFWESASLLFLRLIWDDRAMINLTGREYYVSSLLSSERGEENILRAEGSFTPRVFDRHGAALRYMVSQRDAHFPGVEFRNQTVETISLMYVLLGNSEFGAVEWC